MSGIRDQEVVWRPEALVWREARQGRWVEQVVLGAMDGSGAEEFCCGVLLHSSGAVI